MRRLLRLPACYRAELQLTTTPPVALDCVTRNLHAEGALLHLRDGVPPQVQAGARGSVSIELADRTCVRFAVDVRHQSERGLGVQFVAG